MKMCFDGYEIEELEFEGRPAKLIAPRNPCGRLAFKMEYWEAFPDVEIKLIERGYHLAYIKNSSRFAPKEDCDIKARFVEFLSRKYNLSKRCVPIGMSIGGAQAIRFAGYYPELISCLFLDAPVLDYSSVESYKIGSKRNVWEDEIVKTYPGLRHYQLPYFSENPVHMTDVLLENKIPIVLSYGLQDTTVDYNSNGALLEEAYGKDNELIKIIPVPFRGHHPHGLLSDNSKIVEFIVEHQKI